MDKTMSSFIKKNKTYSTEIIQMNTELMTIQFISIIGKDIIQ